MCSSWSAGCQIAVAVHSNIKDFLIWYKISSKGPGKMYDTQIAIHCDCNSSFQYVISWSRCCNVCSEEAVTLCCFEKFLFTCVCLVFVLTHVSCKRRRGGFKSQNSSTHKEKGVYFPFKMCFVGIFSLSTSLTLCMLSLCFFLRRYIWLILKHTWVKVALIAQTPP